MGSKKRLAQLAMTLLALSGVAWGAQAAEDEEEKSDWEVSAPALSSASREVALDVTTGTWMQVDVSPDGKTIAFDLLGDIYLLPIEGGEARNIAAGFAWDSQPRFSPDGKSIAFTSDRGGGDNIWIMNADGSEARALSDERFRLLSSPTWSPDGLYVAARKHFTTQRSAGTGEIWLYHVDGGKGVAVVERPNPRFQKELGEPAFTPDGESLYYTQNVTAGDTFVYAEDSNKETFRIKRVDLELGEVTDIAGGPGGAVRATPSPDGRSLAFVRRVRARSRLFLKDLESGEEQMLVDELDQDMQESWGVHGMYPGMAWLPDSSAVVFWAGGAIRRVDVGSGQVTDIPFRVADKRTVYEPPRFDQDVAPAQFDVHMLRFTQPLPGSDAFLYEALGRLHVQSPGGTARRLTSDEGEGFELYPTTSRDGRWVYYVRWTDAELGEICRVAAAGGSCQVVSPERGHYRDLALSPDGDTLVVRRSAGGNLLAPIRSLDPGIYSMPAAGGPLALVTRDGRNPHFGAKNDRLYVMRANGTAEEGGAPPRKLVEIDLDGGRPRDIAGARFPSLLLMSPTGDQIALLENYALSVVPLPPTAKLVELGPEAKGLPVKLLTQASSPFVAWSADGESLHWSIGPRVHSVRLADWSVDSEPINPHDGVLFGLTVDSDRPAVTVALTNARIVTMAGADEAVVIERGAIVVRDNRIVAVDSEVDVPADAEVLDLDGKTIVPGFIDIHAHGPYGQELIVPQQNWSTMAHLAFGVTTIHDPSSSAEMVFAASEYARAGLVVAPRIYSTGDVIYGAKAYGFASIDSLDDALAHVRRLKLQGAISVKNYNQPRRDQRQQVVEAARQEGLMVFAEGGALYDMDLNLVADGNTGVEHTLPQQAIYDDVVQFWSQTHVGYTPTLIVGYGAISGEDYWYDHDDVWKHPLLSRWVPPRDLQARSVRRQKAPEEDYGHVDNAVIAKKLADAGVAVHSGAHGQREGLGTHWEMWMLAQGGMSPLEALRAATLVPARTLGMDKDLGSLEPGKLADLVVIDGDVTQDIRLSDHVTHVMVNGRLYEADTLDEVLTGDRTTEPFYWMGRPESDIR